MKGPAYQQIHNQLRQAILSGEIPYGSKLPSAPELARQFNTSAFTIQTALGPLAEVGLIERTRKKGTFVRGLPNHLASAGIYFSSDFWSGGGLDFSREVYRELIRELAIDHVRYRTWIDSRPIKEQGEPLPEIQEAIARGEVQGIIVGKTNRIDMTWLTKTGVPSSFLTTGAVAARVGFDWREALKQGMDELRRQGCRTVGAIVPLTPEFSQADECNQAFRDLPNIAADCGLVMKESWMPISPTPMLEREYDAFGYHHFREIWNQPERPDGLLVYPDVVARGTMTAVLQANISIPRDIKLLFHRNEGIPFLCPLPVSWLVSNVRQVSAALIDQLRRQIEGRNVQPVRLPLALESAICVA